MFDQIIQLRRVLEKQSVNSSQPGRSNSIDIISVQSREKLGVIFLLQVRNGIGQGSVHYFPSFTVVTSEEEL